MISIIVPIYNSEKYLKKCISSLTAQSYVNLEIILVDDGSTDQSGIICDYFKETDPRIKVIHKENGGVSSARNAGLDIAQGEYIMFCDSDDTADREWCRELSECIEKHPDRLPICGIIYLDGNNSTKYRKLPDTNLCSANYRLFDINHLMELSYAYIVYNPVNKIYRNDIIKKYNLRFSTDNSLGEDAVFNMNYLRYIGGKTVYINKLLYLYYGSNPTSLCKADYHAYAKSCETIFNAYSELFTNLKATTPKNVSDLHSYHYKEILGSALLYARDKSMTKKERVKALKKFIYLPAFKKCVRNTTADESGDYKLFKLSKVQPLLMLYIFIKEIF